MKKRFLLYIVFLNILVLSSTLNAQVVLFSDDFEDGNINGWIQSLTAISTEQAHGGTYSAKAIHSGTVVFRHSFTASSEFYAEWWIYTSSTWDDVYYHNGVKWCRINYGQTSGVNIWWSNGDWGSQWSAYAYANTSGCGGTIRAPYFTGQVPVKSAWIKVGVYCKSNTAGANDGIFKVFMNTTDFDPNVETPKYSCTTMRWNSAGTTTFSSLEVISNIETATATCYNYVDDIVIYDGLPSDTCGADPDCDDANPCTDDTCVATVCQHANNTDSCNTSDYCYPDGECLDGVCIPNTPRDCSDSDDCTIDYCDEDNNICVHERTCLLNINGSPGNVNAHATRGNKRLVRVDETLFALCPSTTADLTWKSSNDGMTWSQIDTDGSFGGCLITGADNYIYHLYTDQANDRIRMIKFPYDGTPPAPSNIYTNASISDTGVGTAYRNTAGTVDSTGKLYLFTHWGTLDSVYCFTSVDAGVTWLGPYTVMSQVGSALYGPSAEVTSGDIPVVVFHNYSVQNMYFGSSADGGVTWTIKDISDTRTPKKTIANPDILTVGASTIYVFMQATGSDTNYNDGLVFTKSTDSGANWSNYVTIDNTIDPNGYGDPGVALGSDGTIYVTYRNDSETGSVNYREHISKSVDGGTTWSLFYNYNAASYRVGTRSHLRYQTWFNHGDRLDWIWMQYVGGLVDHPIYYDYNNSVTIFDEQDEPPSCVDAGDCDDSNICTTDTCPAGTCVRTNNTVACDDGLVCTVGEACSGGVCIGGAANDCDDSIACTTDVCNSGTNACENTYGATTVHLNTGDLVMLETGTTTGTAILDCDETAGTVGCCTSLDIDYTLGGTADGGGIDYTVDVTSPATVVDATTPKTITFTAVDDAQYEGGSGTYETIIPSLVAGTNYTLGTPSQEQITLEDNDPPPATPPAAVSLTGLYMLGAMNVLTLQDDSDQTYLDGYAARVTWKGGTGDWAGGLDTGTVDDTPIPVWTYIDSLFTNAAAQTNNHNIMLYVWTAEPPPHVLVHSAALGVDVDTYIPYVSNALRTCPIPWDAAALDDLEVFWAALAAHTVGGVAVKDRPELAGIRSDFLGLKGIRDLSNPAIPGYPILIHDANYNRTLFIAGILTSLHACADVFPGIPIVYELHSMYDLAGRVDTAIIDAVEAEFDGSPNPIIGVYAENWDVAGPSTAGQPGINLLHSRAHGSNVGFQALAPFASQSEMEAALQFGLLSYGCKFFEIYRTNTETASFSESLEKWQNVMNGTMVPGGCTILSTGTGSQTISPAGTGSESIFYPTLE